MRVVIVVIVELHDSKQYNSLTMTSPMRAMVMTTSAPSMAKYN